MSKPVAAIRPVPVDKKSRSNPINWLLKPFGIGLDIVFYVLLSLLFGIIIEWLGLFFEVFTPQHAPDILRTELAYLGDNFATTVFGVSAQHLATQIIQTLNGYLHTPTTANPDAVMIVIGWVKSLGNSVIPYVNAAIYVVMITAIRCVIIGLSMASFVIVGIAAAVDGLHVRELRKVGGDDEHGDVYHWAKASVPKILILSPMLYLAWPSAINPNFILLPGMVMLFVAIFLLFSKYKKVL